MYKGKKIVGIITARSGSKGVQDKNIKILHGKPMIAYTIETAIESGIFDKIIVSTDSQKYADIAIEYGAEVPSLRPEELSQDNTSSVDTILYTLNLLENNDEDYDYFMLLQPTSPLRTAKNIVESVDLCFEKNALSVLSVTKCDHPPEWSCQLEDSLDLTVLYNQIKVTRRQDALSYYQLNGAIYFVNINEFKESKSFFKNNSVAYIMDKENSLDVDNIYDFMLVESVMKRGQEL